MYASAEQRLGRFVDSGHANLLSGGLKGLEKESLRVSTDGWIANSPHPAALGSALTNPYITTDFSEALIELITPPFADVAETIEFLERIHKFVYAHLGDELLWVTSMPCRVGGDDSIPIADYGTSNVGTMKRVYREGLKNRYGSLMQTISGIHYNYSFPDAFWSAWREVEQDWRSREEMVSDGYFRLVRNFQRFGWLIPYLFGASPAICKSFVGADAVGFSELDGGTWYRPHATSLRMSDIGYRNKNQAALRISYNHLDDYIESLSRAIATPFPEYTDIGLKRDGRYLQLTDNFLQIENEYYSFIRPKQVAQSGEKPTLALKRRGVQYVEIRALDVGVFDAVGVNASQLRFLEAFLSFCLFQDSPPVSASEQRTIELNQTLVADRGRDPALSITLRGERRPVRDWVRDLCDVLVGYCELLDYGEQGTPYADALHLQQEIAHNPEQIPSACVLDELVRERESFFDFALRKSNEYRAKFQAEPLEGVALREFEALATKSLQDQEAIEVADDVDFDAYLEHYFSQT